MRSYALMANVVIKDRRRRNPRSAGALQNAVLNSAGMSSIATDEGGVIQILSAGAERMLGYTEAEVAGKRTPADFSDPLQAVERARALSLEFATAVDPGFQALVFKASQGIDDQYELTWIRKDGSRLPAVVSVTALRDPKGEVIGYLMIATDNTAQETFRLMVESVTDCAGTGAELERRGADHRRLRRAGNRGAAFLPFLFRARHRTGRAAARPRRGSSDRTLRDRRLALAQGRLDVPREHRLDVDPRPGRRVARVRETKQGYGP